MKFRKRTVYLAVFYLISIILFGYKINGYFQICGALIEEGDLEELKRIHNEFRKFVIFGFVYFIAAVSIENLIAFRGTLTAMARLKETTDRISRGDIKAEIPEDIKKRDDEFGELARAFDRTLVSLKIALKEKRKTGK